MIPIITTIKEFKEVFKLFSYFMILKFEPTPEDDEQRLDSFLAERTGDEISRTSIQKWIKNGNVVLEDSNKILKSSHKIKSNETYVLTIPPKKKILLEPIFMDIPILLEEEDFVIISKPPGIASHGGPEDDRPSLVNGLLYHYNKLSSLGGEMRPGIVHRLDKPTSGVMVVAKNDRAHIALSRLFQTREVEKRYYAWLIQGPKQEKGRIEKKICRHPTERLKMQVSDKGRKAITNYQIVNSIHTKNGKSFSLAKIGIETGRTHQIRVHFQSLGCPVVGDMLYSRSGSDFSKYGLLLFSQMIRFNHPFEKREIKVELSFPDSFSRFEKDFSSK